RTIGIEAQIEDAEGLMRSEEIAFASDRLETITYGPADFSASMQLPSLTVGNQYNYPGDIFHYVLFKLAVAARAAGIQVIDGPYLLIRDLEGFRAAPPAVQGASSGSMPVAWNVAQRDSASSTARASMSAPMKSHPWRSAATADEPLPTNGSHTT